MKSLTLTIAALFLCSSTLLTGAESINEQIEALQQASPQERAELMNRLKIQLASMNEEDRANAIGALQAQMGGHANYGKDPQSASSNFSRMNQMQSIRQNMLQQRSIDTTNTQFPRMRR